MQIADAPVRHFQSVDSTNTKAERLFVGGERGPLWVLADEQTDGRGRLGRKWYSDPGNLYCTLLLQRAAPATYLPQVSFVVALAVHDAVSKVCGPDLVKLKWPNDVLLMGGKVSGILCEVLGQGGLAIGCGINIAHSPQAVPYPSSHVAEFAREATVQCAFDAYRKALANRWTQFETEGFASIIRDWEARAAHLNKPMVARLPKQTIDGIFRGLAPDGAMRLEKSDGTIEIIYAGDVGPLTRA
ncbi:MAG: biotin--[acetyl-CoA-carboxylase] ligase [Hyphomicrobiales bacterium]